MHVCAHCAATAARLVELQLLYHKLQTELAFSRLREEASNQAFWELAGDIPINLVEVNVVDECVTAIFPADDLVGKGVPA